MPLFIYTLSFIAVLILSRYPTAGGRFSFHTLFSLLYLVTFFAGFPLSLLMAHGFGHSLLEAAVQCRLFALAGAGYLLYYLTYYATSVLFRQARPAQAERFADFSANSTAWALALVGGIALLAFIGLNEGLLLFKLEKYSQIFSAQVQGVALKRFFYFFLVALVLWFLLKPSRSRWWGILLIGTAFGLLSYLAVGGTRANLALAVAFFVILGLYQSYLSAKWLLGIGVFGVAAMFGLALARYGLNVQGREAWFTFLYLTRDSFSPWENLATIFASELEFQGIMPFVREFYVYIPSSFWPERPDIAWNTANYFTKTVLGNQSGLAMSPTLLGSLYIMGGYVGVALGMTAVGSILAALDRLFDYGKAHSAVVLAFCFGQLFNLIVLVREGAEAFFSRFVFFSFIFAACWLLAYSFSHRKFNGKG